MKIGENNRFVIARNRTGASNLAMGWWSRSGEGNYGLDAVSPAAAQMGQQIEMMDLVFRLSIQQCGRKCVPPAYMDGELNKGEAVCTQRCLTKFFDTLELVSGQLAEIGMQQSQ